MGSSCKYPSLPDYSKSNLLARFNFVQSSLQELTRGIKLQAPYAKGKRFFNPLYQITQKVIC